MGSRPRKQRKTKWSYNKLLSMLNTSSYRQSTRQKLVQVTTASSPERFLRASIDSVFVPHGPFSTRLR